MHSCGRFAVLEYNDSKFKNALKIRELDLSKNSIDEGVFHICNALKLNDTITHINLSYTHIGKLAISIS